jgi:hypothetical protein
VGVLAGWCVDHFGMDNLCVNLSARAVGIARERDQLQSKLTAAYAKVRRLESQAGGSNQPGRSAPQ